METMKYKIIKLFKGERCLVSPQDYKKLSKFKWYLSNTGYPMCGKWIKGENKTIQICMHRDILGFHKNKDIDHINRNKLDNRRENFRIVPHYLNLHNSLKQKNNTTGYKGVYFSSEKNRLKKWYVRIQINNKGYSAGRFKTLIEAIKARQELERKYLYA